MSWRCAARAGGAPAPGLSSAAEQDDSPCDYHRGSIVAIDRAKGDLDAAEHPIHVVWLATDLGVARESIAARVGLSVLLERDGFVNVEGEG
jgi:hypothetical protein